MKGVVVDKKLFSRMIKDRKVKAKEKDMVKVLEDDFAKNSSELKSKLVDKLTVLVSGKTSQGVYNNFKEEILPKKVKFTQKMLTGIDFLNVNPNKWTTDKEVNELIKKLINNYIIKYKEFLGVYNRKKFVATVGDDLPNGIIQMAKVYVAKKRKLKVGDKMAGATVIKA